MHFCSRYLVKYVLILVTYFSKKTHEKYANKIDRFVSSTFISFQMNLNSDVKSCDAIKGTIFCHYVAEAESCDQALLCSCPVVFSCAGIALKLFFSCFCKFGDSYISFRRFAVSFFIPSSF